MDIPVSGFNVEARVAHAAELWRACYGDWAHPTAAYTRRQQREREKAYDRALTEVQRTARRASGSDSAAIEKRLIAAFARFAAQALDLDPTTIDRLTRDFLPVGTDLARWARRFDPTLSNADIVQACRNAWTACGLQPLLGAPMRLTPAILGYSLLYPYSDNYLDQRVISRDEKLLFSRRFRTRLQGETLPALDAHEASVWHMVHLIETEFPRALHPQVFESLLAIHGAQEDSLAQLERRGCFQNGELLRITCAKGGTSVLADACLVNGCLDAQESEFSFLWGVLLQLGDDLQDVSEDLLRGSDTLFTRAARRGCTLDALVAQLLNFSHAVAVRMDALPSGDTTHKALLRTSWQSLILMAVAQAHRHFTPAFLASLEPCSPFRFAFLRARREKLHGDAGLFRKLFQLVVSGGAVDTPLPCFPVRSTHTFNGMTDASLTPLPAPALCQEHA